MNNRFSDHVRSGAFSLSLSERMITVLLSLDGSGPEDEKLNLAPYQALQRRGLAYHGHGRGFALTLEGMLVSRLLRLARYAEEPLTELDCFPCPSCRHIESELIAQHHGTDHRESDVCVDVLRCKRCGHEWSD